MEFLADEKLRKLLSRLEGDLSVQAQDQYHLRTEVDHRGEKTLTKDAKTIGGIKLINNNNNAVTKWVLGRTDQAKNVNALFRLCNMKQQPYEYRHNRPRQILQSEQF